jgi:hypothetical protein
MGAQPDSDVHRGLSQRIPGLIKRVFRDSYSLQRIAELTAEVALVPGDRHRGETDQTCFRQRSSPGGKSGQSDRGTVIGYTPFLIFPSAIYPEYALIPSSVG